MTHKTLTIPDILKIKSFSSRSRLQLSPDGEFLAYVVQDPHHKSSFQEKTTEYSIYLPTGTFVEHHSRAVWVTNIKQRQLINSVQMMELTGHHGGLRMDAT